MLGRRTDDVELGRDVRRDAPGGVPLEGQARGARHGAASGCAGPPARHARRRGGRVRFTTSSRCRRRRPAAVETSAESEGPRGLARYRNAAMVGAGGLACATVGAFLGGLGGAFTISPAAAHPLASATTPDQSAARRRAGCGRRGIDERHGRADHRGAVVAVGLAHAERGAAAMADVPDGFAAGDPGRPVECRDVSGQRIGCR